MMMVNQDMQMRGAGNRIVDEHALRDMAGRDAPVTDVHLEVGDVPVQLVSGQGSSTIEFVLDANGNQ